MNIKRNFKNIMTSKEVQRMKEAMTVDGEDTVNGF